MRKLLLLLLLPVFAQAQIFDTGTLQRNRTDSTVRGNFGSRGVMVIPTASTNGTNGYILVFNSATNKYVPTAYTPTPTGLADSLLKKANRTFDNVANGAIPISKLASSTISGVNLGGNLANLSAGYGLSGTAYNGSTARTFTVDTSIIAAKSWVNGRVSGTTNYIPKFTGTNTIGNSLVYDDGSFVGIGYTSDPGSGYSFGVNGPAYFNGGVFSTGNFSSFNGFELSGSPTFGIAKGLLQDADSYTQVLGGSANGVRLSGGIVEADGFFKVKNLSSGTPGTDSILVHDNTTNSVNRIAASYYATASSLSGYLPVNNPTFTGNLSGPTASLSGGLTVADGITGAFASNSGAFSIGAQTVEYNLRSTSDSDNPIFRIKDSRINSYAFAVNARTGGTSVFGNFDALGSGTFGGDVNAPAFNASDGATTVRTTVASSTGFISTSTNHPLILRTNNTPAITLGTDQSTTLAGTLTGTSATFSGNISAANLASGTYTPTLTNGTGVTSSSLVKATYTRVGSIVKGVIVISATVTGSAISMSVTLPIPSNFTSYSDAYGTDILSNPGATGQSFTSLTPNTSTDVFDLTGPGLAAGTYEFRVGYEYEIK